MTQPDRPFDHEFALAVWHRRKWHAVVASGAALAAALSVAFSLPDMYRASASVLVERQQISEAFVRPSVTAELETRIQTIHQQIMSRAHLTRVITDLGLYPAERGAVPVDALVARMRRDVKLSLNGVEQMSGRMATISFSLSYSGTDPIKVAEVLNTLVAAYVEENTRSRERQATRTADFLKAQLDATKQQLDEQDRRAGEYKLRYTAELPQQVEANLAALERLNTQLRLNGEYQLRTMERRERLEHQLSTTAAANPRTAETPSSEIDRLRQRLADLRAKYSDRYPDVIRLTAEIAALEARPGLTPVASSPDESRKLVEDDRRQTVRTISELQTQLETLRQEERVLRQVIATYEGRVENAPRRDEELQQLSREYSSSKERYDALLKRYEEARLAETLEQGQNVEQFRVLDPAIPPPHPAAPNRLWLLIMGVFASLGAGFCAIVLAERLDGTLHTVDDLRQCTTLPTVAAIRRIPTATERRRHQLRLSFAALSFVVALALIVAGTRYFATGNEQMVRMTARGAQ